MPPFTIRTGSWNELQHDAKLIREQVFIQEQNIPAADEWDTQDAISRHFVVFDQAQPVATARLLQNNSIGRVAVLKAYRGQGIGRLLMLEIIQQAKHEQRKFLKLSSQVHAVPCSFMQDWALLWKECNIWIVALRILICI